MAGKREKPEEIVPKLRQVEVLQGQGMKVAEAVRQIGVTQQTYWRKHYGGMGRDQLKRLKGVVTGAWKKSGDQAALSCPSESLPLRTAALIDATR